ncbi:transmembrane domain protein [Burkholderia pseudomallei TSV32]|nr:transmembrane domain protein [Burkholderia pseudomallei TSV32]
MARGGAGARGRTACRPAGQDAAPHRRDAVALDAHAERHRGLPEGRGDERRGRHARAVVGDDDERARAGPVLRRRGARRDGLARRLQFPVGMGVGRRGRARGRRRHAALDGLVRLCRASAILENLSPQYLYFLFLRDGS